MLKPGSNLQDDILDFSPKQFSYPEPTLILISIINDINKVAKLVFDFSV
jgi:hypothetical protein